MASKEAIQTELENNTITADCGLGGGGGQTSMKTGMHYRARHTRSLYTYLRQIECKVTVNKLLKWGQIVSNEPSKSTKNMSKSDNG